MFSKNFLKFIASIAPLEAPRFKFPEAPKRRNESFAEFFANRSNPNVSR